MANVSSLRHLMDHTRACAGTLEGMPRKYKCWGMLYPEILCPERGSAKIKNIDQKCSRFVNKDSEVLREKLRANARGLLVDSAVTLPERLSSVTEEIDEVSWYVRWAIRSPLSPYRKQLLTGDMMACAISDDDLESGTFQYVELFDDRFLDEYMDCLRTDWALSDESVASFRGYVNFMAGRMRSCADEAKTYEAQWPRVFNQAFVDSHAQMGSMLPLSDIMADTFAMLVIASLFGPGDYRWEMGYLNLDQTAILRTEVVESGFESSAKANGTMATYPIITRVTYDERSLDEQDYIVCSDSRRLKGVNEVRFGRMMRDTVAYDEDCEYDVAYVCLVDPNLPEAEQVGVSRLHARLKKEGLGWVLYNWKSDSGVLVVSRQGDYSVVGGKGNDRQSLLLENGDVICFGHSFENGSHRANALLPCYAFQWCVDSSDLPERGVAQA